MASMRPRSFSVRRGARAICGDVRLPGLRAIKGIVTPACVQIDRSDLRIGVGRWRDLAVGGGNPLGIR